MYSSCPPPESGSLPRANLFMERAFDDATFTCFDETMRHLNLAKNKLAARPLRGRAKIILRLPALRVSGRVIFPDLGPMSDDDFIDLVRRAIQSGFRVYIKDLPFGQAAVPTLKDNRTVSLAVSSEFRPQVEALRRELRSSRNSPARLGSPRGTRKASKRLRTS